MEAKHGLLVDLTQSGKTLTDVVGYFEFFDDDKSASLLCAISLSFNGLMFSVLAQEDDSFDLYRENWHPDSGWNSQSLIDRAPWSLAKGKPLIWSWVLVNQQGYLDGLQLEFAKNSADNSIVVQLVAMGSEVMVRSMESQCRPMAFGR